ncbi:MAG: PKD domain-containing protein, partial [Thermoplasmatales archaeon]|nr:PKD domain-containing protein [Thermoplasmatales archaeon]
YMFDWGDNTSSNWVGPYNSGVAGEASHIWADPGEYDVRVKAKDVNGGESSWSDPVSIHILQAPIVDIGVISGGLLKISTLIKNKGEVESTGVQWSITLDGGMILLGKESNGEIPSIPAGENVTITSDIILGFGETEVTVTAEIQEGTDTRSQGGKVFLFFIYINPGGGI